MAQIRNNKVKQYIDSFFHYEGDTNDWKSMTDEQLAGYFLVCYGVSCGGAYVYESNEGMGDCEGWADFPESERAATVHDMVESAVLQTFPPESK